jgi:hypothetical protein
MGKEEEMRSPHELRVLLLEGKIGFNSLTHEEKINIPASWVTDSLIAGLIRTTEGLVYSIDRLVYELGEGVK